MCMSIHAQETELLKLDHLVAFILLKVGFKQVKHYKIYNVQFGDNFSTENSAQVFLNI